ncbi:heparinase II/III family protein [Paenibacillus sp. EC2-1]|uniref:heparinase II/III family protein n=1 Tax=Paenibacillus sp. EC2-1 TaxID=3388665 RepID=UPI003BEED11D
MPMPQADFFGVWDKKSSQWTLMGKLNYTNFPEMSLVESCVKQGDYKNAEIELLQYFRQRQTRVAPSYESNSAYTKLAPLLADQIIPVLKEIYLDTFHVTQTPNTFSLDVLAPIRVAASSDKVISFMLMGRHKGTDPAYIYSMQHDGSPPILTLEYNGHEGQQTLALIPIMDTYIRGYDSDDHSQEPLLEVLESGSPYDKHTSKSYLKFDLSTIPGDVTSAILQLTGYTDSEESVGIMVFQTGDNAWDEHTFTFDTHNGKTFSWQGIPEGTDWIGPPATVSDNQYPLQIGNFTWLNPLIAEYAATNNEAYAGKYIDYMVDFIQDAEHYVTPGAINMGSGTFPKCFHASHRAANWVKAYHQLKGSPSMNAEDHTMILKALWKKAAALSTEAGYDPRNNHGIYETQGLYSVAVYFPEFTESYHWIELANSRIDTLIVKLNFSDGSYSESSSSYSIGAAEAYMAIKSIGHMNSQNFSETFDIYLRRMGYYIANLAFPDGYLPLFGDGSSLNSRSTVKKLGELYEDDVLLYLGTGGEAGSPPTHTSSIYPVSKTATMRSGWGTDARYLFMNVKQERSHRHSDDNSIIYYAYGRQLLVDPGTYSYSDEPISNWLRFSTEAHNTVEINQQSQDLTEGAFRHWTDNNRFNFIEGVIYNVPGFAYSRNVLFLKTSFTIVSDYICAPEGKHLYRQHWHFLPTANVNLDSVSKKAQTNFLDHLGDIHVIPVDPQRLSEATMKQGYYSNAFYTVTNSKYVAYTKEDVQGDVTFDTILYPTLGSTPPSIKVERLEVRPTVPTTIASAIRIDNISENFHTGYYYLSHEEDPQEQRFFDMFAYEGKLAYIETDGNGEIRTALIQTGRALMYNSIPIISSNQSIHDIAVAWNNSIMEICGSHLTIAKQTEIESAIAVYAQGVTFLRINGKTTPNFTAYDDYIYVINRRVCDYAHEQ